MGELEEQLRRYADAAESRVPATSEATTRRRPWRPILAVAAALLLTGGTLGVFLGNRDTAERIDTVPATVPSGPRLHHECPPPAEHPQPEHLRMILPWVGGAEEIPQSSPDDDAHVVVLNADEARSIKVRVEVHPPGGGPGDPPATSFGMAALVCDPFAFDGPNPRRVTATVVSTEDQRSIELPVGDRWTLSLSAVGPDPTAVTVDEMLAVLAGISWPAAWSDDHGDATAHSELSTAPPADACPAKPEVAIEVGSFTLTAVPEGFEPQLPVEEYELGPGPPEADAGGPIASLLLLHPDGRTIEVTSFGAESPRRYIESSFGDGTSSDVTVRRCIHVKDGWEPHDGLAIVGTNGGSTRLGVQHWEYEGFLVIGSPEVAQETLVELAEALRFGAP